MKRFQLIPYRTCIMYTLLGSLSGIGVTTAVAAPTSYTFFEYVSLSAFVTHQETHPGSGLAKELFTSARNNIVEYITSSIDSKQAPSPEKLSFSYTWNTETRDALPAPLTSVNLMSYLEAPHLFVSPDSGAESFKYAFFSSYTAENTSKAFQNIISLADPKMSSAFFVGPSHTALRVSSFSAFQEDFHEELTGYTLAGVSSRWLTPVDGLSFRSALQGVELNSNAVSLDRDLEWSRTFTIGADYIKNNWSLSGEFSRGSVEADGMHADSSSTRLEPISWYVGAAYQWNSWFSTEVSYSEFYYDSEDMNGAALESELGLEDYLAWQKTAAISTKLDLTEHWDVKFGVNFNNGVGTGYTKKDAEFDEDWIMYQFKTTLEF